jgi:membrane protease YdiL (CAAX protease family)
MPRLKALEPAAMFLFLMGYIWIWRARHPHLWIWILVCLLVSHLIHGESARELGFGRASLNECAHRFAPLLTVMALAMLAGGLMLHTTRRMAADQAFLALLAYLPWGIVQQYLINGYFLSRLDQAFPRRKAEWVAAVLFSLAHTPNLFLMAVGLVGGWCSALVYRRHRNLYFLGMAHAAIGFLLFVTVSDSISHHLQVGPGMLHKRELRHTIK